MKSKAVLQETEMMSEWRAEKLSFLIIGAAKSATTTLQTYLQRHPDIFMTYPKEPTFFAYPEVWKNGPKWYEGLFQNAPEGALCGEASTTYTRWPHTLDSAQLIHQHTNVNRFIYIMRHPVDRAYSHYCHHMRTGVTKSFEQALEDDQIYVDTGLYMDQLERYLRFYDKSNFLFLFTDDLKNKPEEELRKVQEFLGLEFTDLFNNEKIRENSGKDDHYLRHKTVDRLRENAVLSALVDVLPSTWKKSAFNALRHSSIGQRIANQNKIPDMKPETRTLLLARYKPHNDKLADFLDKDLSQWNS